MKRAHDDLEICEDDIKQIIRLGKSGGSTAKGRPKYAPIRIEFRDFEVKKRFLQSGKYLNLTQNEQLKNVNIAADLTLKEREERRLVYGELLRRREAGENDIRIFKGQIVKINSSGPDSAFQQ